MLEGMINQSEFVEQTIVIGDRRKYVSALIVPDFEQLRLWAKGQGLDASDKEKLIAEKRVVDLIKQDVEEKYQALIESLYPTGAE
jgi:long-chain acyl-CoA synthetase